MNIDQGWSVMVNESGEYVGKPWYHGGKRAEADYRAQVQNLIDAVKLGQIAGDR
ncbi:hypothetical protein [Clavibacter capsici]|uniref:hypothetical protein n=1 Tax=Clavibacter capsici TaxID=1874630 RepID=UPI001428852E|nr:hypothetical protein [Clavibacter capsici]QIS38591.1 hypothetical protein GW572_04245 [Clavibacter capsici]